jgi:hypothetical protein
MARNLRGLNRTFVTAPFRPELGAVDAGVNFPSKRDFVSEEDFAKNSQLELRGPTRR